MIWLSQKRVMILTIYKRYFLSLLLTTFLFSVSLTADAAISREEDSFKGQVMIKSLISKNTYVFSSVNFAKIIKNNEEPSYGFVFNKEEREWWFFENCDIEYKVDDDPAVYKMKVIDTDSEMWTSYSLYTNCIGMPDQNMIDRISKATKITFRVYFRNHPPVTWTVPDNILKEWQTVINLDKDGHPINK